MNTRICIGIPTYGTIKSKTALCLLDTLNQNKDLEFLPLFCHSGYIAENFNKIVRIAQDMLCSHIFFVEHDMSFPPDTIKRLLAHDVDAVGVLYNCRYLPLTKVNWFYGKDGEITKDAEIPTTLFEAPVMATGCALVKTSVFSKIDKPYFPMEDDQDGNRIVTQDVGFSEKIIKAGMKVWCDPTIVVGHIGDYNY
jgi:GT2 family glycosyltransferase